MRQLGMCSGDGVSTSGISRSVIQTLPKERSPAKKSLSRPERGIRALEKGLQIKVMKQIKVVVALAGK